MNSNSNLLVYVSNSSIHQRGLYAKIGIPKNTRIIEYFGPHISKKEGDRLSETGNLYIYVLNRKYDIDGDIEPNIARFINHACYPNSKAVTIKGRAWIISHRKIKINEEITYDYEYEYIDREENPCHCKHPECVGYIIGNRFKKKDKRKNGLPLPRAVRLL